MASYLDSIYNNLYKITDSRIPKSIEEKKSLIDDTSVKLAGLTKNFSSCSISEMEARRFLLNVGELKKKDFPNEIGKLVDKITHVVNEFLVEKKELKENSQNGTCIVPSVSASKKSFDDLPDELLDCIVDQVIDPRDPRDIFRLSTTNKLLRSICLSKLIYLVPISRFIKTTTPSVEQLLAFLVNKPLQGLNLSGLNIPFLDEKSQFLLGIAFSVMTVAGTILAISLTRTRIENYGFNNPHFLQKFTETGVVILRFGNVVTQLARIGLAGIAAGIGSGVVFGGMGGLCGLSAGLHIKMNKLFALSIGLAGSVYGFMLSAVSGMVSAGIVGLVTRQDFAPGRDFALIAGLATGIGTGVIVGIGRFLTLGRDIRETRINPVVITLGMAIGTAGTIALASITNLKALASLTGAVAIAVGIFAGRNVINEID